MRDQSEMMRKYKKMKKLEQKLMKKKNPTNDDLQDLFDLRQDMSLILDYLDPLYSEEE